MRADFADADWLLIWPAYAITFACFAALAVMAVLRLRKWARAAQALDQP